MLDSKPRLCIPLSLPHGIALAVLPTRFVQFTTFLATMLVWMYYMVLQLDQVLRSNAFSPHAVAGDVATKRCIATSQI
jgi:hypothetical protein